MELIAGVFFFGLTITLIVGKGVLMSQEFAETEWERQNREKHADGGSK